MKMRIRLAALASTVLAALALTIGVATPANATVNGTVMCANGLAVQGVWVNAQDNSKDGWAYIWNIGGSSHVGWTQGSINPGDTYAVHVGCGSWSPTYTSVMWNAHSGDFICIPYSSGVWNRCWNS